ncbi:MAG: SIR2 family protein [Deltaproteobacteria bacterium]|nr:SIR2 family protein [Deltaproteobacteria bacterium]
MGSIIKAGYIDRVLTTNFDTILSNALYIQNFFPAVYDFTTSKDVITDKLSDISILHLHGRQYSIVQLHTHKDFEKHFKEMDSKFKELIGDRNIIVIGYSGKNNPVFKCLRDIKDFEDGIYWVGYKDDDPEDHIKEKILSKENSRYMKGYDADSFFIKLAELLEVTKLLIIDSLFNYLLETFGNIVDVGKDDIDNYFILEEPKKRIKLAKKIFEDKNDVEKYFPELLNNNGINLCERAYEMGEKQELKEMEKLYRNGFLRFKKAVRSKPDSKDAEDMLWECYNLTS